MSDNDRNDDMEVLLEFLGGSTRDSYDKGGCTKHGTEADRQGNPGQLFSPLILMSGILVTAVVVRFHLL